MLLKTIQIFLLIMLFTVPTYGQMSSAIYNLQIASGIRGGVWQTDVIVFDNWGHFVTAPEDNELQINTIYSSTVGIYETILELRMADETLPFARFLFGGYHSYANFIGGIVLYKGQTIEARFGGDPAAYRKYRIVGQIK